MAGTEFVSEVVNRAGEATTVRQGRKFAEENTPLDRRVHWARIAAERAFASLEDPHPDPIRLHEHLLAGGVRNERQMRLALREYRRIATAIPGSPVRPTSPELAAPPLGVPSHVGYPCRYCGRPAQALDHVWPQSRGGDDHPNNLVPACTSCNSIKGTRSILGDACPHCGTIRHPGDVDTPTGFAFYHCRCGSTWSTAWNLQRATLA